MLKEEQANTGATGSRQPVEPFTYGDYLRVPELLDLQTPLQVPGAHDEMLFIIAQQVQELWFKQILHELQIVVAAIENNSLLEACRLLSRVNKIVSMLGAEASILETMPPQEFHNFRHVLTSSSGLESEQFREIELASGLNDQTFLKLIDKFMDVPALQARWPVTLRDAFQSRLRETTRMEPVDALVEIYALPAGYGELFMLAEALSEYEVVFSEWRFHHVKLVERTIGDRAPGTAGSSGAGYLGKTLGYRFFPELWEARTYLDTKHSSSGCPFAGKS